MRYGDREVLTKLVAEADELSSLMHELAAPSEREAIEGEVTEIAIELRAAHPSKATLMRKTRALGRWLIVWLEAGPGETSRIERVGSAATRWAQWITLLARFKGK
jgi:hypothetical protein